MNARKLLLNVAVLLPLIGLGGCVAYEGYPAAYESGPGYYAYPDYPAYGSVGVGSEWGWRGRGEWNEEEEEHEHGNRGHEHGWHHDRD